MHGSMKCCLFQGFQIKCLERFQSEGRRNGARAKQPSYIVRKMKSRIVGTQFDLTVKQHQITPEGSWGVLELSLKAN